MAASAQDFDEYNKPGAERLRRRRREEEDDDLDSDLEGDLLEEDWLSAKKNPSEASDEELNDDLLQSDDEDTNMCGQDLSLNATVSLGESYDQQDHLEDAGNDIVNLGTEGYEEGNIEEEDYQQQGEEEYAVEYRQVSTIEEHEDQMEYTGELGEEDEVYQDEILDIQINEPIDNEFQDDDFSTNYTDEQLAVESEQQEETLEECGEMEEKEELTPDGSQVQDLEEVDNDQDLEEETKEESDEEEDDDEESGRLRFKTERKDVSVVRLADAESKRRNIPETLELSEEAKADLLEFEERERQKKMGRFGGRGRGGGGGGMGGWHGGARGRGGFPAFGMGDFRGDCGGRGRMNAQRLPLMTQMGMQTPSRMSIPHHQQRLHQQQRHHAPGPRGPPPFQEHGGPLAQQPLQPLIAPHMAHRSPPVRAQMEPPARMMSPPPANHQQQPPQPKNIHINPHFRGPASSPAQVPLMPPTQSQPRPAVGPQRFPGPGEFQQHMPSN
ncbi:RNA-binding protein 33, partial [Aplochiton taeniatus]